MRGIKIIAPAIAALALAPVISQSASAAADPTGIWLNDTGRGAVEIKPCGNKLCGNVVWVKSAKDADGCGKQIMGDVANVGGGVWDNGWVYSPERGRKFDVELKPLSNGTLRVMGYAGTKFFSQTMIWTKAPQDLQLCGQTEAKAETPKTDIAPVAAAPKPAPAPEAESTADETPAPKKKADAPAKVEKVEQAEKSEKADKAEAAPAPATKDDTATTEAKKDPAPANDDTADNNKGGGDIGKALGGLKLGDLNLDKVLTKTRSGKCQLNTPWIKVQFACEH